MDGYVGGPVDAMSGNKWDVVSALVIRLAIGVCMVTVWGTNVVRGCYVYCQVFLCLGCSYTWL